MNYTFDGYEAKKYGIPAAVLLSNLRWWIAKNKANGKHQHDGRTWSYNSMKALAELYPFFSERQIRYALDKLEQSGVILTGNFNGQPYDRTKWYALIDESTCQNCQMHSPKLSNGIDRIVEPIPDSKPDSKPTNPPNPPGGTGGRHNVIPKGASRKKIQQQKRIKVNYNTPLMIRIGEWFDRRPDTLWNVYEARALFELSPAEAEVDGMEAYYKADIQGRDCRRRNIETLLNNWQGELDRARKHWKETRPQQKKDYRSAEFKKWQEA